MSEFVMTYAVNLADLDESQNTLIPKYRGRAAIYGRVATQYWGPRTDSPQPPLASDSLASRSGEGHVIPNGFSDEETAVFFFRTEMFRSSQNCGGLGSPGGTVGTRISGKRQPGRARVYSCRKMWICDWLQPLRLRLTTARPQRLKPWLSLLVSARLKSCPSRSCSLLKARQQGLVVAHEFFRRPFYSHY